MDKYIKSFDPTINDPLISKMLGDNIFDFNATDKKLSSLSKFCEYNRITVDDILTLLLKQTHEEMFDNEVEKLDDIMKVPTILMQSTLLSKITRTTYEQTLTLVDELSKDIGMEFKDMALFMYLSMANHCLKDICQDKMDDTLKSALQQLKQYSNTDNLFK